MDFGCGTGLVGKYLYDKGFREIEGIDASPGMLKSAEEKKCHTGLYEAFLGTPETFKDEWKNKYHFVTGSGILAENHLDKKVFDEILLALVDNGICIFTTRIEYLTKYGYGPYMEKLVNEGKWKLIKTATHTKYDKMDENIGRYKPTEVTVFAY